MLSTSMPYLAAALGLGLVPNAALPDSRARVSDAYSVAVVTPDRILSGMNCGSLEYALSAEAGRTVAGCEKIASIPFQSTVEPGGGHVLRLGHDDAWVFVDCRFDRSERFRRADGSFEHTLEFRCAGLDGPVLHAGDSTGPGR